MNFHFMERDFRRHMPHEFYKTVRHNNYYYTLHSIYDGIDFDADIERLKRKSRRGRYNRPRINFDRDIEVFSLTDDLEQLVATNLFD